MVGEAPAGPRRHRLLRLSGTAGQRQHPGGRLRTAGHDLLRAELARVESMRSRAYGLVPFFVESLVIESSCLLPPGPRSNLLLAAAAALTVVLFTVGALYPVGRTPRARRPFLVVALLAPLLLLRVAAPTATSAITAAGILPAFWLALHRSLRSALAAIAVTALIVALWTPDGPLLSMVHGATLRVGAAQLRAPVVIATLAALICTLAHRLVSSERRRGAELETLTAAFRSLADEVDAREDLCAIVARAMHADRVVLLEPQADGCLQSTASSVADDRSVRLGPGVGSTSYEVFRTGRRQILTDVSTSRASAQRYLAELGIVSSITQPVLRGGRCVAVLSLQFRTSLGAFGDRTGTLLDVLAGGVASAIARMDLISELAANASTDPLTGLANRRRWEERARTEIAVVERSGAPLALAMLDLDHFKVFNDTHGHLAGDRLLVEFAAAVSAELRQGDTVARWGGEEFTVLLPGCSAQEAREVAGRLLAGVPAGLTCSIGLASRLPGESHTALVGRADSALFQAKESGRNRIVEASAVPGPAAPAGPLHHPAPDLGHAAASPRPRRPWRTGPDLERRTTGDRREAARPRRGDDPR